MIKPKQTNFSLRSRQMRTRGRRQGVTIVMVAVTMTALLGFLAMGVDYGLLVSDANQLQRGCDAAALQGASQLYKSGTTSTALISDQFNARQLAVAIALRNGVVVDPNPLTGGVTFPALNKIKVTAVRNRSLFFAGAIGQNRGTVTRSAIAGRIALKGVNKAVPLAMTTVDYYANIDGRSFEYKLINNHDTDFVSGTIASLDLRPDNGGKSGAVFQDDLTSGFNGTIFIGQKISNSLNADIGSQGSKLELAMQDRFNRAAAAPYFDNGSNNLYPNYPADDPRILLLIVALPNLAANNNPTLNAQLFVPVYIESIRSPGNKAVYMRLRILPSLTYNSQNPMISLDVDTAVITGPSVVSLIQ